MFAEQSVLRHASPPESHARAPTRQERHPERSEQNIAAARGRAVSYATRAGPAR
ncbi:hypothetical protein QFZ24_008329 [Streptomyces phaeochromogenes]|uniref:hypothetical protein n=1 Tax=Streptomyces phaeochromogenes TaxID=1923 RepID=UPI002791C80A|nr:hypothetical protein [Streptomyces phaeochromogenes]MDQ0954406.1 hypothetical protein [Streptomyces phaeochromogenes]